MANITKQITDLLQQKNHALQYIFNKIKLHQQIQQKLLTYVDPKFAAHIQIGNIEGRKLTIFVVNASILNDLRYKTEELLRKFQHDPQLKHISTLDFKVSTSLYAKTLPNLPVKKMECLSQKTAEELKKIAAAMSDDKLREIFERIATRVRPRTGSDDSANK